MNTKWPRHSSLLHKMAIRIKIYIFFICGSTLLNLLFVYDLGAETDVYFLSFDVHFIAKFKMDVILPIDNKNNEVILNTKHKYRHFQKSLQYSLI